MTVLKKFQQTLVNAIVDIANSTAEKILRAPAERSKISAAQGCILLEAPTASGKTLMITNALQVLRGGLPRTGGTHAPVIWFWFAPFADLVDQTMAAIRGTSDLTTRDPKNDREWALCRDGDIFVSTWQSVSTRNVKLRKMREDGESTPSIDTLIARLKDDGYFIGAVIDEAHHNFKKAPQALGFYLDILRPDVTIMATATPDDEDLEQFQRFAGITAVNRLSVSRNDVVKARLNKVGVNAFFFKASAEEESLLDYDEIAVLAGVERHRAIKRRLTELGLNIVPLVLVQVENLTASVDRARRLLIDAGLAPDSIAIHTADQPDKNLRALASDQTKQALIFKMAVATGFDVPRAWTLVSLRPSRSVSFGIQVIGRIMRVHPRLQIQVGEPDSLLDYGHVFLSDYEAQPGLQSAASRMKAITTEIRAVTDVVNVIEIAGRAVALTGASGSFLEMLLPPVATPSLLASNATGSSNSGEFVAALFASLADQVQPASPPPDGGDGVLGATKLPYQYALRMNLGFPLRLEREVVRAQPSELIDCIAKRIDFEQAKKLVMRRRGTVKITVEDLFASAQLTIERKYAFSAERVAVAAQIAFRFNDSLDPRDLKLALVNRLRRDLEVEGLEEQTDEVLRKTVDLALFQNRQLLSDACRECKGRMVAVELADPMPGTIGSQHPLVSARLGAYAVFGPRMNDWETRFAQVLDNDATGSVLWWIRNAENTNWACRIVRPSGRNFFPDFVIGVHGRKKLDNIALAEVKERIETEDSAEKVRAEHKTYGSAIMVSWDQRYARWEVVDFVPALGRNQAIETFAVDKLIDLR